jgi:hypothetical protein
MKMTTKTTRKVQQQVARATGSGNHPRHGAVPGGLTGKTNRLRAFLFAALLGGMMPGAVSCSDDADDDGLTSSTISAKWEISDPGSMIASIEFNKDGHYILVTRVEDESAPTVARNSAAATARGAFFQGVASFTAPSRASGDSNLSPVHFGTYKIEGDRIILSGFGVINVISIAEDEFTFSFTLTATGETGEYVASKAAAVISSSSRTEMLCRSWKLERVTVDESLIPEEEKQELIDEYGADWKAIIEQEETEEDAGMIALFSRAGTYLVLYANEDEEEAGLSEWKWTSSAETAIYYSWYNWEDEWTENVVSVVELTKSTLKIQERATIFHLVLAK